MALVYGVLGVVVILTAGTFGTINASPWFNAAIAALFVVLALAMFDVIPIDFSRYSSGFRPTGRGTFGLAFTMGGVASLALALPFALGVGMALPWPVAGAGLANLPKPGMWMVRIKQAFGVFILASAAYYGYVTYTIVANLWVDATEVRNSVQEKLGAGWTASLADGLARANRDHVPVTFVKVKVQAEDPDAEPIRTLMARLNAIGLPTYVILFPTR